MFAMVGKLGFEMRSNFIIETPTLHSSHLFKWQSLHLQRWNRDLYIYCANDKNWLHEESRNWFSQGQKLFTFPGHWVFGTWGMWKPRGQVEQDQPSISFGRWGCLNMSKFISFWWLCFVARPILSSTSAGATLWLTSRSLAAHSASSSGVKALSQWSTKPDAPAASCGQYEIATSCSYNKRVNEERTRGTGDGWLKLQLSVHIIIYWYDCNCWWLSKIVTNHLAIYLYIHPIIYLHHLNDYLYTRIVNQKWL